MPFRIFVSYSTKDLSHAAQIKELLESAGAQVFVAEYSLPVGAELTPKILAAIKACDLFLLLWSESAKKSEWVPQEIGAAKAGQRPIVPLLLDKGGEVPGFLRGTKYLRVDDDPTKAYAWLQKHVLGLASEKSKTEGLVLVGVAGVILWALSQGK